MNRPRLFPRWVNPRFDDLKDKVVVLGDQLPINGLAFHICRIKGLQPHVAGRVKLRHAASCIKPGWHGGCWFVPEIYPRQCRVAKGRRLRAENGGPEV